MIKYIILGMVTIMVAIQFVGEPLPENRGENPQDLLVNYSIEGDVADLLRASCYDCHSQETKYPFYSKVAPVSWLIGDHVRDGREELNFSEWESLTKRKKIRKLKDIAEEVGEKKMPLESYIYLHEEAKLSSEQRQVLIDWANEMADEVMSK